LIDRLAQDSFEETDSAADLSRELAKDRAAVPGGQLNDRDPLG
jgi:hypothetical protein